MCIECARRARICRGYSSRGPAAPNSLFREYAITGRPSLRVAISRILSTTSQNSATISLSLTESPNDPLTLPRQKFQGHAPPHPEIFCLVNHTHAAAQLQQAAVMRNLAAILECRKLSSQRRPRPVSRGGCDHAKKFTGWQEAESIGITDRRMRPCHERYEASGYNRLLGGGS